MNRFIGFYLFVVLFLSLPFFLQSKESPSPLEDAFVRLRPSLTCLEGPTSEPSCSGTGLTVYLRGEKIEHLDWGIEMSMQTIRRRFYFEQSIPKMVVETIHKKQFDAEGMEFSEPRLVSVTRYQLDATSLGKKEKELCEHADFLIRDFRKNQKEFQPIQPTSN